MAELTVNCPNCQKQVVWSQTNRFKPFCSERCKLIDLGEWANETYRVPVNNQNPAANEEDRQE